MKKKDEKETCCNVSPVAHSPSACNYDHGRIKKVSLYTNEKGDKVLEVDGEVYPSTNWELMKTETGIFALRFWKDQNKTDVNQR